MGSSLRDIQASGQAELEREAMPQRLTARQKYRRFFADYRRRCGHPHAIEAEWERDNGGRS